MLPYTLASITKGKTWYISYYQTNPRTGEKVRFRRTYGLNRIKNKRIRFKQACKIRDRLNELLPLGFPFTQVELQRSRKSTAFLQLHGFDTPRHQHNQKRETKAAELRLYDAIQLALEVKQSDRERTNQSYQSVASTFLEWAKKANYRALPVVQFEKPMAIQFLDWLRASQQRGARTRNNYIIVLRALFYALQERGKVTSNPFTGIKRERADAKRRRKLSTWEIEIIMEEVKASAPELLLPILLLRFCFIRPAEMRRLQVRDLDLERGLVVLSGHQTKNRENSVVTIPEFVRAFMQEEYGEKLKGKENYYLIGRGAKTSAKPCGRNALNKRFQDLLRKMVDKGKLEDITGISFYSWKDTGVSEMLKRGIRIDSLKRQLRHKDLSTTQQYLNQHGEIDQAIKKLLP